MALIDCTIHLIALNEGVTADEFFIRLAGKSSGSSSYLLKGRAHGWVHRPHVYNTEQLLGHNWDLFFLAQQPKLPDVLDGLTSAHLSVQISIPESQYETIVSQRHNIPIPMADTLPLPDEWGKVAGIPQSHIDASERSTLMPGELRLDKPMAAFLSNVLPPEVSKAPVSLINLFKYPQGDRSVHEHYMEGFKESFGNAAGATVKFMGPVTGAVEYEPSKGRTVNQDNAKNVWEDANLVQYDTIWHYAYMLSTKVYAELNKEKVAGLEDTCILCVSEVELARWKSHE